jgi:hypothetical protein
VAVVAGASVETEVSVDVAVSVVVDVTVVAGATVSVVDSVPLLSLQDTTAIAIANTKKSFFMFSVLDFV